MDTYACVNLSLLRLTRSISRYCDARLRSSGLRTTQYTMLACVQEYGPIRPVDLAQRLSVDPSTLSRTAATLVQAGWLAPCGGDDARSRPLALTDLGQTKMRETKAAWRLAQRQLVAHLSAEKLEALLTLSKDIVQSLNVAETGDAPSVAGLPCSPLSERRDVGIETPPRGQLSTVIDP